MGLFHTVGTHKVPKKDLPVPVLAEHATKDSGGGNPTQRVTHGEGGEARESTTDCNALNKRKQGDTRNTIRDSRGGQNLSKEKARKKRWRDKHGAEYMKMYRAAQKLLKAREKGSIK